MNGQSRDMKRFFFMLLFSGLALSVAAGIDRTALLERNNPRVHTFDALAALMVGNGGFALTVDATGLQTFPDFYRAGVPLGIMADWSSHSLGSIGFLLSDSITPAHFTDVVQTLQLSTGIISSSYRLQEHAVSVNTVCHPQRDMVAVRVVADTILPIRLELPPSATDQGKDGHATLQPVTIASMRNNRVVLEQRVGDACRYVVLQWQGDATLSRLSENAYVMTPSECQFSFTCEFLPKYETNFSEQPSPSLFREIAEASAVFWTDYWNTGGMVDFSGCSDARAPELERRVVLSQYLLAVNSAHGSSLWETAHPNNDSDSVEDPETLWWQLSPFSLWGHGHLLNTALERYVQPATSELLPVQPAWFIYLAELLYRAAPTDEVLHRYYRLVQMAADSLRSAASPDTPLEISSWRFGWRTAGRWRERLGMRRQSPWVEAIDNLPPLAVNADGLYLSPLSATATYTNARYLCGHPAMLGIVGLFPQEKHDMDSRYLSRTFDAVWTAWDWSSCRSWDFALAAMCAVRIGQPEKVVEALLMDCTSNVCLPSGLIGGGSPLRVSVSANGALLNAVALMCAGWDDSADTPLPSFPGKDEWNVQWEGLLPLP